MYQKINELDESQYIDDFINRFGICSTVFEDIDLYQVAQKKIVFTKVKDPLPNPYHLGIGFLKIDRNFAKPFTSAVKYFYKHSSQNIYELSDMELRNLAHSDSIQTQTPFSQGFVMLGYKGIGLGLARTHQTAHQLVSMIPKSTMEYICNL